MAGGWSGGLGLGGHRWRKPRFQPAARRFVNRHAGGICLARLILCLPRNARLPSAFPSAICLFGGSIVDQRLWGALPVGSGVWEICTWAPSAGSVEIELAGTRTPLEATRDGHWIGRVSAEEGASYRLIVNGEAYPDPASRLQAGDVHAPSRLVDHSRYPWSTQWRGRPWAEAVIYELHIGTFTPQGTFAASAEKLEQLASLGITAIEVMPVGQWSGTRGWGYDCVLPFAPHPSYGSPDEFKAFVERAHGLGIMVMLDLVMNHFGPDGAYLHALAPEFFDPDRHTPWGAAIDFSQDAVRAFWIECASMWIRDYRLDGLRLDAVHQIAGPGADDFFDQFGRTLKQLDPERSIHLVVEDERNEPHLRDTGLYDASWNDDFHHAVHTALTGESQDYYASFAVDPIGDLSIALQRGHIEEGQPRKGRDEPRGKPSGHLQPTAFVNAIQTHDQIGNRPFGDRLITLADPDAVEVAYALLLVAPYIPMIVMGEERGETSPFQFFADYHGELGKIVRDGRAAEFAGIAALGDQVPDPNAIETFNASKLSWKEDAHAARWLETTRRCLSFRHQYVVPMLKSGRIGSPEVQRIGQSAIQARWTFADRSLQLALNFGDIGRFTSLPSAPQFTINDIASAPFALAIEASAT